MNTALTALERAVIQLVADQHWPNFRLDQLEVTSRECTGVGRYMREALEKAGISTVVH